MKLQDSWVKRVVTAALEEDIGLGDVTTEATVSAEATGTGRIWAKEGLVLAGLDVAAEVFNQVDSKLVFTPVASDGDRLLSGADIATVEGPLRGILTAERTALNLLQRMSGVATLSARCMAALSGTKARVIDTRKTTPCLRMLEKYAVSVGGGSNHRWALDSGILIKDNHIIAAGGLTAAVNAAREYAPHTLRVEVECKTLAQVQEAVDAGVDVIMLDNMRGDTLVEAVSVVGGCATIEASGGITVENIKSVAIPGVDLISVGALTHSARAMDIALDLEA